LSALGSKRMVVALRRTKRRTWHEATIGQNKRAKAVRTGGRHGKEGNLFDVISAPLHVLECKKHT
jgi:hypothetical protein